MTDGEGREHFHYLERGELRVPATVLYRTTIHGQVAEDEVEKGNAWGQDGTEGSDASEAQGLADVSSDDPAPDAGSDEQEQQPYPALAPVVFFCIKQTTRPRSWCLRMVCNPYPLVFFKLPFR